MSAGRSAETIRNRRAGQQKIRRRCSCGAVVTGNAAWWSHTTRAGRYPEGHPEHRYGGRA